MSRARLRSNQDNLCMVGAVILKNMEGDGELAKLDKFLLQENKSR